MSLKSKQKFNLQVLKFFMYVFVISACTFAVAENAFCQINIFGNGGIYKNSNKIRVEIEQMPEGSSENIRKHFFNEFDQKFQTEIYYQNGQIQTNYFRADGTVKRLVLKAKNGLMLKELFMTADGKNIESGFENREDGTLKIKYEQVSGIGLKTSLYWYDGKSLFKVQLQKAGVIEQKFYRIDGSLWLESSGPDENIANMQLKQYDRQGNLKLITKPLPNGTVEITNYKNGLVISRMISKVSSTGDFFANWDVIKTEEFDNTGAKVKRIIHFDPNYAVVTETQTFLQDGTSIVRKRRDDGFVGTEERLDKNGKRISIKKFGPKTEIQEDIDESLMRARVTEPMVFWQEFENDPSLRNSPLPQELDDLL